MVDQKKFRERLAANYETYLRGMESKPHNPTGTCSPCFAKKQRREQSFRRCDHEPEVGCYMTWCAKCGQTLEHETKTVGGGAQERQHEP